MPLRRLQGRILPAPPCSRSCRQPLHPWACGHITPFSASVSMQLPPMSLMDVLFQGYRSLDQGHLVTSSPPDHSCKDPICKGGHTHGFQGQDLLGGQSSSSTIGRFWGGGLGEARPLISWQHCGEAGAKALRQAPSWGRKRERGQSLANHGLQLLL